MLNIAPVFILLAFASQNVWVHASTDRTYQERRLDVRKRSKGPYRPISIAPDLSLQQQSESQAASSNPLNAFAMLLLVVNPTLVRNLGNAVRGYLAEGAPYWSRTRQSLAQLSIGNVVDGADDLAKNTKLEDYFDDVGTPDPLIEEDTSLSALTDDICLLPGDLQVRIEEAPSNSRRIFTGIDIFAPVDAVWETLTDYESLQDVVPSLVSNEVVSRTADGGARLAQVGGAKVLPGVTFKANLMLDVVPYDEDHPIPSDMLMEDLPLDLLMDNRQERQYFKSIPLRRGVFPRPYAYTSLPHRDLTMQNVAGDGDFLHYQGVWRMQELPGCAPPGKSATRLTYAVEIQPRKFLPVRLIEGRIAADLKQNMEGIKSHVEHYQA
jgi:hypothetical protein